MKWGLLVLTGTTLLLHRTNAFSLFTTTINTPKLASSSTSSSSALFGKTRKAKKTQKVERSRPKSFYDAIDDANDIEIKSKPNEKTGSTASSEKGDASREARAEEARRQMDARPDVSTMIVDEETGMEMVAQGKSVMDVVTRKPVKLLPGANYRLAQMFPGVPPEVRQKYRINLRTATIPDMVEQLREACSVKLEDGTRGIPPHPSVANKAVDFVLANRDLLGPRMKRLLGRLTMREMSLGNEQQGTLNKKLWKNFLTLENHISAPFRQMVLDAEGRVGPNFGNLDVKSYCSGELYERVANYLVLKGMVAHWEKKVVDADYTEKTPQTNENYVSVMAAGDPRRFLPDPPILFTLKECTQVCYMAQQMTKTFVETPELFNDLPPEIRFIEQALAIRGGTPLRQFMIEDFCPREQITPEALREGVRRLIVQFDNMQVDPYADITNTLEKLERAMSVGTDDERDPYVEYLANKDIRGPGYFQSYTFNHEQLSLVRFLDGQYEGASGPAAETPLFSGGIFGFGGGGSEPAKDKSKDTEAATYKVPPARAAGRPHNLGWLEKLKEEDDPEYKLGKVPAGRIIMED